MHSNVWEMAVALLFRKLCSFLHPRKRFTWNCHRLMLSWLFPFVQLVFACLCFNAWSKFMWATCTYTYIVAILGTTSFTACLWLYYLSISAAICLVTEHGLCNGAWLLHFFNLSFSFFVCAFYDIIRCLQPSVKVWNWIVHRFFQWTTGIPHLPLWQHSCLKFHEYLSYSNKNRCYLYYAHAFSRFWHTKNVFGFEF